MCAPRVDPACSFCVSIPFYFFISCPLPRSTQHQDLFWNFTSVWFPFAFLPVVDFISQLFSFYFHIYFISVLTQKCIVLLRVFVVSHDCIFSTFYLFPLFCFHSRRRTLNIKHTLPWFQPYGYALCHGSKVDRKRLPRSRMIDPFQIHFLLSTILLLGYMGSDSLPEHFPFCHPDAGRRDSNKIMHICSLSNRFVKRMIHIWYFVYLFNK